MIVRTNDDPDENDDITRDTPVSIIVTAPLYSLSVRKIICARFRFGIFMWQWSSERVIADAYPVTATALPSVGSNTAEPVLLRDSRPDPWRVGGGPGKEPSEVSRCEARHL